MRKLHLAYITDTCIFHFALINDIITEQMTSIYIKYINVTTYITAIQSQCINNLNIFFFDKKFEIVKR